VGCDYVQGLNTGTCTLREVCTVMIASLSGALGGWTLEQILVRV
jgi:hypothetical protein